MMGGALFFRCTGSSVQQRCFGWEFCVHELVASDKSVSHHRPGTGLLRLPLSRLVSQFFFSFPLPVTAVLSHTLLRELWGINCAITPLASVFTSVPALFCIREALRENFPSSFALLPADTPVGHVTVWELTRCNLMTRGRKAGLVSLTFATFLKIESIALSACFLFWL